MNSSQLDNVTESLRHKRRHGLLRLTVYTQRIKMDWLSRKITYLTTPKMSVFHTWKYAFLNRFPCFLKTKWGRRFCDRFINEVGLERAVRRDSEFRKMMWEPFLMEERQRKELRALVNECFDRRIETLLQGMSIPAEDNSPSGSGHNKDTGLSSTGNGHVAEDSDGNAGYEIEI